MKRLDAFPEIKEKLSTFERPLVIYFLIDDDQIVYIGKTGNIGHRVAQHSVYCGKPHSTQKRFTSVSFFPVSGFQAACELERTLIKKISPKYNHAHTSETLKYPMGAS